MKSWVQLMPKILGYKAFRSIGKPLLLPINITLSVTNRCNSRCATCCIWKRYVERPDLARNELTVDEFSAIFRSLGAGPFWFTLSGGEPFLRSDLTDICDALARYCRPAIVTIPSNGALPDQIESYTRRILEKMRETELVINLSLDGIAESHDEIRGVKGSFKALLETNMRLRKMKGRHPNLHVGIHTVVSRLNLKDLTKTYDFVRNELSSDSFLSEVAEERAELLNERSGLSPSPSEYAEAISKLSMRMKRSLPSRRDQVSRITEASRLLYYKIASETLIEQRQIIPCYAGIASCQISAYGEVWPCCVQGDKQSMGNLRRFDYDFRAVWQSEKAEKIRRSIRRRECWCPLANAHYTSMLCSFSCLTQIALNLMLPHLERST